jgi:hypothetical protein
MTDAEILFRFLILLGKRDDLLGVFRKILAASNAICDSPEREDIIVRLQAALGATDLERSEAT